MLKNILTFIKKVFAEDDATQQSSQKSSIYAQNTANTTKVSTTTSQTKKVKTPNPVLPTQPRTPYYSINNQQRIQTIQEKLQQFANGISPANWEASRLLYKVGELRIPDATYHLLNIAENPQFTEELKDDNFRYSLIWALGRCGGIGAAEMINKLIENPTTDAVQRLALDAYLQLASPEVSTKIYAKIKAKISKELDAVINNTQPNESDILLLFPAQAIDGTPPLYLLYLLSAQNPSYRSFILDIIAEVPLDYPYFQSLRYIFKSAEFRDDFEVLGLISVRLDIVKHSYETKTRYEWDSINRRYNQYRVRNEKKAFSNRTKAWFQKRIIRKLNLLGEQESAAFCSYAAGILQYYPDTIITAKKETDTRYTYVNRSWKRNVKHYRVYPQIVLPWLTLNTDSEYVTQNPAGSKYKFIEAFHEQIKDKRSEPFQTIWENNLEIALDLLIKCRSNYVAKFALRILENHPTLFTKNVLLQLAASPLTIKVNFALRRLPDLLSTDKYEPEDWKILFNAHHVIVRDFAISRVERNPEIFFNSAHFAEVLTFNMYQDIAIWFRKNCPQFTISEEEKAPIFKTIIERIQTINTETEAEILLKNSRVFYQKQMRLCPIKTASTLLKQQLENTQLLGAAILVSQKDKIEDIPEQIIAEMMSADFPSIRYKGMELFGALPLESLLEKRDILVSLAISEDAGMRDRVKPIISKLVEQNPKSGVQLASFFVPILLEKENYEGLHDDILDLLTEYLDEHLDHIPSSQMWDLINARYRQANILGAALLPNLDFAKESIRDIIKLANHEMPDIRQQCYDYFNANVGRIRYEAEDALKILDSKREESRNFAFDFFTTHYKSGDWTPELLISLCDSTLDDVQGFGKKMLQSFFQKENGEEYLLKLSSHPNVKLQVFATNYLQDFAADNVENFKELLPYFKTVLCQLYKGGTTKKVVFDFLEKEALKNSDVAKMATEILNEVSLTVAIGDKARCIQALCAIQREYPDLETVLEIEESQLK